MRWLRLLVVGMVLSLFAGSFRDAALHPTDVASVVGARSVAALHLGARAGARSARASGLEAVAPRPSLANRQSSREARVATADTPPPRGVGPRPTPWLARRLYAEHAALLC